MAQVLKPSRLPLGQLSVVGKPLLVRLRSLPVSRLPFQGTVSIFLRLPAGKLFSFGLLTVEKLLLLEVSLLPLIFQPVIFLIFQRSAQVIPLLRSQHLNPVFLPSLGFATVCVTLQAEPFLCSIVVLLLQPKAVLVLLVGLALGTLPLLL